MNKWYNKRANISNKTEVIFINTETKKQNADITSLYRDEYTEYVYNTIYGGEPIRAESAEDVIDGISRAVKLDSESVFIEGVAERLTELGVPCALNDTETMKREIRQRFKDILGKNCPKAVLNWIDGTPPGVTNRQNNYELCYALELDFEQTSVFFQKNFLTVPFNVKSGTDAIFFYCFYHDKPYSDAAKMLEKSKNFVLRETYNTATAKIALNIKKIENDDEFMEYLSTHCYSSAQQYRLAKDIIKREVNIVKKKILADNTIEKISPDRLNSLTVSALLGYKYQLSTKSDSDIKLPKRFTLSLPNDETLGKILNDKNTSYETLRKTLILLKFYNFYSEAVNERDSDVADNLMDFTEELNSTLNSCGFAQLYLRHPFDCLLLYCANSYDPILTLHYITEYSRT